MGWPNHDPEGWDKVCREAVAEWLENTVTNFHNQEYSRADLNDIIDMFQSEHPDVFDTLLLKVPNDMLNAHEVDYLNSR